VLGQMKAPPLGGVRDYRYLVETHGPWVADKGERHHFSGPPTPALAEGKSFMFAAMVCVAFGLLIGGGVLANAYFSAKPAARSAAPPVTAGSGALLQAEEQEFSIFGVSLTLVPDKAAEPASSTVQPVTQPASNASVPPKAEAVR
jgi:hypothetical protein